MVRERNIFRIAVVCFILQNMPSSRPAFQAGTAASTSQSTTAVDGSFNKKCAQVGVLGCWAFDDPAELKYSWYRDSAALNRALAGRKFYYISRNRSAGEGNTVAIESVSGEISVPVIDKAIYSSGGGSLKFTIPSQSEAQVGWFQDNFNKVLGNASVYISPKSPLGNVVYYQFRYRVNDAMLNTVFRTVTAAFPYWLSTPAAGSTTIKAS